jgi:hypothetical protein
VTNECLMCGGAGCWWVDLAVVVGAVVVLCRWKCEEVVKVRVVAHKRIETV